MRALRCRRAGSHRTLHAARAQGSCSGIAGCHCNYLALLTSFLLPVYRAYLQIQTPFELVLLVGVGRASVCGSAIQALLTAVLGA